MCLHGAYRHIRERERERLRGAAPDDSSLSVKDPSVRPSARPVFLFGWLVSILRRIKRAGKDKRLKSQRVVYNAENITAIATPPITTKSWLRDSQSPRYHKKKEKKKKKKVSYGDGNDEEEE